MDYRDIERKIYRLDEVPINKNNYYPEIDEETFAQIKERAERKKQGVHVFPFYIRTEEEQNYLDIYIFGKGEDYKRLVLQKGYCLSKEDEELLFEEVFCSEIYNDFEIIDMSENLSIVIVINQIYFRIIFLYFLH